MARKKSKFRGSRSFTIPVAAVAGIISMPAVIASINDVTRGDLQAVPNHIIDMVGMSADGVFRVDRIIANITPLMIGALIHKFVGGKLGVNRMLASAGVPIIRL